MSTTHRNVFRLQTMLFIETYISNDFFFNLLSRVLRSSKLNNFWQCFTIHVLLILKSFVGSNPTRPRGPIRCPLATIGSTVLLPHSKLQSVHFAETVLRLLLGARSGGTTPYWRDSLRQPVVYLRPTGTNWCMTTRVHQAPVTVCDVTCG